MTRHSGKLLCFFKFRNYVGFMFYVSSFMIYRYVV